MTTKKLAKCVQGICERIDECDSMIEIEHEGQIKLTHGSGSIKSSFWFNLVGDDVIIRGDEDVGSKTAISAKDFKKLYKIISRVKVI